MMVAFLNKLLNISIKRPIEVILHPDKHDLNLKFFRDIEGVPRIMRHSCVTLIIETHCLYLEGCFSANTRLIMFLGHVNAL